MAGPVAYRLAAYRSVALAAGNASLTSDEISAATGVNATQVRRDLSALGRLGKRGVGYRATRLAERLREVLAANADTVAAEASRQIVLLEHAKRGMAQA